ncbi:unnamed protein product [Camellia sinensis]
MNDDENAPLKQALVMLIDDTDMSVLVSDKSRIASLSCDIMNGKGTLEGSLAIMSVDKVAATLQCFNDMTMEVAMQSNGDVEQEIVMLNCDVAMVTSGG